MGMVSKFCACFCQIIEKFWVKTCAANFCKSVANIWKLFELSTLPPRLILSDVWHGFHFVVVGRVGRVGCVRGWHTFVVTRWDHDSCVCVTQRGPVQKLGSWLHVRRHGKTKTGVTKGNWHRVYVCEMAVRYDGRLTKGVAKPSAICKLSGRLVEESTKTDV
jgi:hypothetical protein